jgi:hypothetical protein
MPIHKKDRSFQNIVSELEISSVPTEFLQQLSLVCENGERILFDRETLDEIVDSGEPNLVKTLIDIVEQEGLEKKITDVELVIDYKKLEQEVHIKTKELLEKNDNS